MTEAWQVREYAQQEFVRALAREVRDLADASENYEAYIGTFAIYILRELLPPEGSIDPEMYERLLGFQRRINGFVRVPSEKTYLLWLLFKELQETIASLACRDYQREQIENPQAVFGAPSAVAEIDLAGRPFED